MNVYRMRQQRCGLASVHSGEDAVDCLVTAGSEDGCSENLMRFGVYKDLDESVSFAFLDGAADAGHGSHPDQCGQTAAAYLRFRHSDMREGRIDVERVHRD